MGRDSYSRAEGPPAIIFKPLQPTLELVEIKHRITGISASVLATTALHTDRRTDETHRLRDRQASTTQATLAKEFKKQQKSEKAFVWL